MLGALQGGLLLLSKSLAVCYKPAVAAFPQEPKLTPFPSTPHLHLTGHLKDTHTPRHQEPKGLATLSRLRDKHASSPVLWLALTIPRVLKFLSHH